MFLLPRRHCCLCTQLSNTPCAPETCTDVSPECSASSDSNFAVRKLEICSHVISEDGVLLDQAKLLAVTVEQLWSFIRLRSYFHRLAIVMIYGGYNLACALSQKQKKNVWSGAPLFFIVISGYGTHQHWKTIKPQHQERSLKHEHISTARLMVQVPKSALLQMSF